MSADVRPFITCVFFSFFYADDCPGGASVWSSAAGALWRGGGESRNTPAQKWSTEFKNHHSWDWHLTGPGTILTLTISRLVTVSTANSHHRNTIIRYYIQYIILSTHTLILCFSTLSARVLQSSYVGSRAILGVICTFTYTVVTWLLYPCSYHLPIFKGFWIKSCCWTNSFVIVINELIN